MLRCILAGIVGSIFGFIVCIALGFKTLSLVAFFPLTTNSLLLYHLYLKRWIKELKEKEKKV